jgi:asparagine synthase (glutamine-hydrolysing)
MCGIVGELNFRYPVDVENIIKMADAIKHRGPDGEGFYINKNIGLGHRRLSIIDLSDSGKQPMISDDRSLVIVFNGEIYNYQEIRSELAREGCTFSGSSDTEVVVQAIQIWGLDRSLERFIGMFAFALWDTRKKILFLVRDRLGVKPLYYQINNKSLIFASEPKALYTHPNFLNKISSKGLGQFFCFGYTLGSETVFDGMSKLPAGHWLSISGNGDTNLHGYWSIDHIKRGSFKGTFDEATDKLLKICDSAFKYRLIADVPVGVFLSGGVDSVFLSAFIKNRLGKDLQHFTLGFSDTLFDESVKASRLAQYLGINHSTKVIDDNDAQKALLKFTDIWDEPFGDTSGIPTSILSQFAGNHVKVALSADGGDELFCGYESYGAYKTRYDLLSSVPCSLRAGMSNVMRMIPYRKIITSMSSRSGATKKNPQTIARFEKMLELFSINGIQDIIRVMNEKGWTSSSVYEVLNLDSVDLLEGTPFDPSFELHSDSSIVDVMMRSDLKAFLGEDILTKVDRASMAHSLECRDPFLDHRLVEFAYSLPLEYLYKDGVHKRILREKLKSWIPESEMQSPKKGFSIPLYDWLKGPWKSMVMEHLSPAAINQVGILNSATVKKELDYFYKYEGGRSEKIMLMLNFQMWANRWL